MGKSPDNLRQARHQRMNHSPELIWAQVPRHQLTLERGAEHKATQMITPRRGFPRIVILDLSNLVLAHHIWSKRLVGLPPRPLRHPHPLQVAVVVRLIATLGAGVVAPAAWKAVDPPGASIVAVDVPNRPKWSRCATAGIRSTRHATTPPMRTRTSRSRAERALAARCPTTGPQSTWPRGPL